MNIVTFALVVLFEYHVVSNRENKGFKTFKGSSSLCKLKQKVVNFGEIFCNSKNSTIVTLLPFYGNLNKVMYTTRLTNIHACAE